MGVPRQDEAGRPTIRAAAPEELPDLVREKRRRHNQRRKLQRKRAAKRAAWEDHVGGADLLDGNGS